MFDYDLYLKHLSRNKKKCCLCKTKKENKLQGVFLDVNIAFANDTLDSPSKTKIDPDDYYLTICNFFKKLEDKANVQISVAAHPRSHYANHPEYYDEREVVRGKTIEMVQNSDFVLCHVSTSVGFAVLFGKPIIFITTNAHELSDNGPYIKCLASLLGKKAINISSLPDINLKDELIVNKNSYRQYINDYIKHKDSQDIPYWKIFVDSIKYCS